MAMSAWWRLSSNDVISSSFSLSAYSYIYQIETLWTSILHIVVDSIQTSTLCKWNLRRSRSGHGFIALRRVNVNASIYFAKSPTNNVSISGLLQYAASTSACNSWPLRQPFFGKKQNCQIMRIFICIIARAPLKTDCTRQICFYILPESPYYFYLSIILLKIIECWAQDTKH